MQLIVKITSACTNTISTPKKKLRPNADEYRVEEAVIEAILHEANITLLLSIVLRKAVMYGKLQAERSLARPYEAKIAEAQRENERLSRRIDELEAQAEFSERGIDIDGPDPEGADR